MCFFFLFFFFVCVCVGGGLNEKKLTKFAFWKAVEASPGGCLHKVIRSEAYPEGYFTNTFAK